MARFPKRRAELMALAERIAAGLADNPADYPSPPVTAAELRDLLAEFVRCCDEQTAAQAAAEKATAAKQARREQLVAAVRSVLRYAEDAVDYDDGKLTALGWGARAAPSPLQPPGQPQSLKAPRQGENSIVLQWRRPADGGAVAAYRIERRQRPKGRWSIVGMAVECRAELTAQQRGVDWEYRVIATNRAGNGPPSNTIAAVL